MKFVDDGEVDDKIVVVPADDRNNGNAYNSLDDLPEQLIKQLHFHFSHYKDLKKKGSTIVESWGDVAEAKEEIKHLPQSSIWLRYFFVWNFRAHKIVGVKLSS